MIPEIVYWIVLVHFISDFPMQDSSWGAEKWHDSRVLLKHVVTYSLVWFAFLVMYQPTYYSPPVWYSFGAVCVFTIVTFITHLLTDYLTSKLMHKFWVEQRFGSAIPNWGFFTFLGIDQLIHMFTLFWTYNHIFA